MVELSKGDKYFLSIFLICLLIFLWIFIPLIEKISILKTILLSIAIALFLFLVLAKKTLSPGKSQSKLVKGYNVYAGWDRRIHSIIWKIGAIAFVIAGIYAVIGQEKYWGLGFIMIFLGPLVWYLAIQANERAKEFFDANKK